MSPLSPRSYLLAENILGVLTCGTSLVDPIGIVDYLCPSATATAHPLASVEEGVALIACFELNVDAELILVGRRGVGNSRVGELLEDFFGASAPTNGPDGDICGWFICCLEKIIGVDVCCQVLQYELGVLATGL